MNACFFTDTNSSKTYLYILSQTSLTSFDKITSIKKLDICTMVSSSVLSNITGIDADNTSFNAFKTVELGGAYIALYQVFSDESFNFKINIFPTDGSTVVTYTYEGEDDIIKDVTFSQPSGTSSSSPIMFVLVKNRIDLISVSVDNALAGTGIQLPDKSFSLIEFVQERVLVASPIYGVQSFQFVNGNLNDKNLTTTNFNFSAPMPTVLHSFQCATYFGAIVYDNDIYMTNDGGLTWADVSTIATPTSGVTRAAGAASDYRKFFFVQCGEGDPSEEYSITITT